MAINELTLGSIADASTTAALKPTEQVIDTDTGVYLDVKGIRVDKVAFLVERDDSTIAASVVIGAGTAYTDVTLGAKTVSLATHATQKERVVVSEWSRAKDSNERINITCTGSTCVLTVAAIKLP